MAVSKQPGEIKDTHLLLKQPMVSDKYSETENVERQLVVSRIQCQMIVALNRNAVPTYVSNVVTVSRDFSVFVSYMQRG